MANGADRSSKGGATVIVIVLVVLGVAAAGMCVCGGVGFAVLAPAFQAANERAHRMDDKNQLRQIAISYNLFWDQHGPDGPTSWNDLYALGLLDEVECQQLQDRGAQLILNVNQRQVQNAPMSQSQIVLLHMPTKEPGMNIVAMADGSVQELEDGALDDALAQWAEHDSAGPDHGESP
ncbi:MAG: hypothetical protein KDA41_08370 [Planctomycetales bacterium]|nr:hypothetical protein [Planctomycetales bacterium]